MKAKRDPALYRRMSEPFADAQTADVALSAFFEELSTLREKHRIGNVHVTVAVSSLNAEGEEGESIALYHLGDPMKAEAMTAYAYGVEQTQRENLVVSLLAQGKGKRR